MHENVRSVDTDFCSEFFQRPVDVVPWRNEHYAISPHIPAGRVAVRPSYIPQNARSLDTEFCSGFFHRPVNIVPWRKEHYATPPQKQGGRVAAGECRAFAERTLRYPSAYARRKGCGKTIPHASERKVGGFRILPKPGECRALAKRTLRHYAAYTGRNKTILHSSERKVGGYRVLF
ncbi:hypothetical protein TNCT_160771 [Trichonephila clavata]|uniref:Uncharacterized protein n=1 Tax=Trichonephila clavata TaxID=2740835 RepID=A0A8X6GKJ7_TRICU|nr:hypothetical protein TNCT_160771 [Trichonephila clavata]